MKTKKMISTVSYNTRDFLEKMLNDLVKRGVLEYWFAIAHKPEEDESKAHIHLCMLPCTAVDTIAFRELFKEADPVHIDKPLGCMPIRTSRWADWYLYAVHDTGYLLFKCESRKYHYSEKDIFGSDLSLLHEMVNEIDKSKYRCYEEVIFAADNAIPFSELVAYGKVPLGWIYQFKELYNAIVIDNERTVRGFYKQNHEQEE